MKGKPGTAMSPDERRKRNAARMRAKPHRQRTDAERTANTEKMRRYRATPTGRASTRRAAKKNYHTNKYNARCHAMKRFRGWLCDACNTGLGLFRDNPVLLRAAANYLELPL